MLLHGGLLHLLFNLLAIASVGPRIEELYGRATMLGLLIVTGDHESGGLTIEEVGSDDESGPGGTLGRGTTGEGDTTSGEDGPFRIADSDKTFALDWTTGSHSGVTTPVTAEGPGSERLSGHYPNTRLHEVVRDIVVD